MNIKDTKEIIYKLQSSGFEIFEDNSNNSYSILKHVCYDCNEGWHTNKEQCIFCGSIGYNVKICDNKPFHISLIAGKREKCGIDGCSIPEDQLEKSCINPDCESNVNTDLKNIIKKTTGGKSKGTGIFSTNSPFCISQSHCFYCGSDKNYFLIKELTIKEFESENEENFKNFELEDKLLIARFTNTKKFLIASKNSDKELRPSEDLNIENINEYVFSNLSI